MIITMVIISKNIRNILTKNINKYRAKTFGSVLYLGWIRIYIFFGIGSVSVFSSSCGSDPKHCEPCTLFLIYTKALFNPK